MESVFRASYKYWQQLQTRHLSIRPSDLFIILKGQNARFPSSSQKLLAPGVLSLEFYQVLCVEYRRVAPPGGMSRRRSAGRWGGGSSVGGSVARWVGGRRVGGRRAGGRRAAGRRVGGSASGGSAGGGSAAAGRRVGVSAGRRHAGNEKNFTRCCV
jgi:hypothetical protein